MDISDAEQQIGELARRLDGNDALVLFPEGGNFTARRRARAIAKLRRRGLMAEAAKAEAMRYVLPPRPGGVLSVLDSAPEADVVWVAHTGTDHRTSLLARCPPNSPFARPNFRPGAKDLPVCPVRLPRADPPRHGSP